MFDRIKIGLLGTLNPFNKSLYNRLQEVGDVKFIGPNEYRVTIDLLVLPPNTGVDPTSQCFENGSYSVIPPYMIDPFVMYFVANHLDYIIKKRVPIIGIGDGCAILWNKIGGKCVLADQSILCKIPKPQGVVLIGNNDFIVEDGFSFNNELFGFPTVNSAFSQVLQELHDEILEDLAIIKSTPLDDGEEPASMFIEV